MGNKVKVKRAKIMNVLGVNLVIKGLVTDSYGNFIDPVTNYDYIEENGKATCMPSKAKRGQLKAEIVLENEVIKIPRKKIKWS